MRISDATIQQLLKGAGKLTDSQLALLQEEQKRSNRPLQDLVIKNDLISDKELTQLYSKFADIPFVEFDAKDISKEMLAQIPERIARQYNAVVFGEKDGIKQLAMEDPDDVQAIDFIQKYIGPKYKLYLATKDNVLLALENYRGGVANELSQIIEVQREDTESQTAAPVSEQDISEDSPIAQTVNLILEYAIRSGASDIHIEPREEFVQIRYRIDGVLKEANRLPKNVMDALVSRIKILSNLKIDERRVPQDGRFKVTVANHQYAFRVSTLPVTDGEKVAMRILNESTKAVSLEDLGVWGTSLRGINDALVQPHGMLLVTGPTGSGKSTTLFSCLTILNHPTVNISTVEDPIEYKVEGANQTQVNPKAGMTFAAGLRALLRQDPNIIMVGEIRDSETADLAVQAALTGHLVLSTLHTNNAATCLPRLLDMKIEPFLIASTVRVVVGQRLIRTLCAVCKQVYAPTNEHVEEINRLFGLQTEADYLRITELEKTAITEGVGKDVGNEPSIVGNTIKKLWKANENGCEECGHTGYKGRIGIYEVLINSNDVQKLIVGNATSTDIQNQAIKEGMITMQIDGLIKAVRGQTSLEEILRVTRE